MTTALRAWWGKLRRIFGFSTRAVRMGRGMDRLRMLVVTWLEILPSSWGSGVEWPLRVCVRGWPATVYCRLTGSDSEVVHEVLIEGAYELPEDLLREPRWIVDLGANIGVAAAYFAARYTGAKIVAVEALPANVGLLKRTAQGFGGRVEVVSAAVKAKAGRATFYWSGWWTSGTLEEEIATVRQGSKDRAESKMARQPITVDAVTVPMLLERYGVDEVDLLKIDVEGTEHELLEGPPEWLRKVRVVVMEIHDKYIDGESVRRNLRRAGLLPFGPRKGRTETFARLNSTKVTP